ncbi:glutathione S-transferase family protein [Rosenbergiella epipactidis]|uniref:glutathione S-transferase family protein n=1 Tax=Rosenbergiella epipactidis TaxID=1544694 RepID=UPI00066454EC|nr:glutathione S-transferase family protein [Rosenbergiella epipactidis]KMV68125.1 glutathione S-transferase [bacteria symbiont BFo2 of Frankliniella occidentalis]KYP90470.1 glutathione S-transferase [bacteria symbiont BFo2 of Frankliniella occidentalis]KYP94627.1 glutathione S-transferase [bacteria symbiont BFo2 of Frankliniella occidentalis]
MLQVWGRETSSNVQAVMWCIGELELDYQRYDYGHHFGGLDSDAFYQLNPNRTIPVLQDDDHAPLWESGAILRYLASRYAPETFWPEEIFARCEVDRWAEWAKVSVVSLFTQPIFWQLVRTPADERDLPAITRAIDRFESKLAIADQQLNQHPFLAGEHFSLADIQLGHLLYRYYQLGIAQQPFPALNAYYQRLTQRPAYQRHVMVSYQSLRV